MLTEDKRKQLDDIVGKMVQNGESEDSISFVVNDFKNKYAIQEPDKTFLEKTAGVLDMVFGGGKIGEAIGTKIASMSKAGRELKRQEEQGIAPQGTFAETFKQPTKGQLAGSALQSGALFIPAGAGAKAITTGAKALGMKTGVSALGKIGAGAGAGYVFDIANNLQQGKTGAQVLPPGFGAVIGGAIPAAGVAKNVIVRFGERKAPRIINSLIKPLQKDISYGKNPGRAVAEEGIIANNFDDLITKIRDSRQTIGQSIGTLSESLSTAPIISVRQSLSPLDDAIKVAASQNNQTLISRLNNVKRTLTEVLEPAFDDAGNITIKSVGSRDLDNLTFKQVRNILSDVGDLTQFTGNPSDDKLVNAALKQVYGKIKGESLNAAKQINPQLAGEFEKLTEKYADLTSAEIAAKYRDKIIERQNLIGLSPQTAGIATGLLTAVATGGAAIPSVIAGISGAVLEKLASTPGFKTRLAYLLSNKTQREATYLFRKIPALSKFFTLKAGATPGDVILTEVKKTLDEAKNLPNKQGGFVRIGKETPKTKELLTKQIELDNISSEASKKVRSFANSQGLIDDATKSKPDYIQAKRESDIALRNLQNFNSSSEGKLLQAEMRKLGVVERQQLRKEIQANSQMPKSKVNESVSSLNDTTLLKEARGKSLDEFVKARISKETGFADYHQAPKADKSPLQERLDEGGNFTLSEVVKGKSTAPNDFFDKNVGPRYYSYNNLEGMQSATAIDNVRRALLNGKKDVTITAYRTVPKEIKTNTLQNGDWITFSKEYAEQHGMRRFDGKYRLIEQQVKPDEVWWDVNDINEWGYDNGKGGNRLTEIERKSQLEQIWKEANKSPLQNNKQALQG